MMKWPRCVHRPGVAPSGFAARREKEGLRYPRHVERRAAVYGENEVLVRVALRVNDRDHRDDLALLARLNAARVSQKTTFLIELKPSPEVFLEGARDRCHRSEMLTSEDHRQLAEHCIRLAKTCTKPPVAEQLVTLAANYLELAERALRLRQPASAVRQQIKVVRKG